MIALDGAATDQAQRLGEFTTSFLNPATAASVTLDASGLDARYGGRLSSVLNLETRDGTIRARSPHPGRLAHERRCAARGPHARDRRALWWATARGTYVAFDPSLSDGAMPSFGDVQFKTRRPSSERTRLTIDLGPRDAARVERRPW